jgi:hypothetical protein
VLDTVNDRADAELPAAARQCYRWLEFASGPQRAESVPGAEVTAADLSARAPPIRGRTFSFHAIGFIRV